MLVMAAGVAHYATDTDGLFGVAPWLPCIYFAAGSVAGGVINALTREPQPVVVDTAS